MESIQKSQCGDLLAWPTKEELFREPPVSQECDICSLPMSNSVKPYVEGSLAIFLSCCGKRLCIGCHYTHSIVHGKHRCPFCRKPYVDVARDQKNNIRRAKEKKDPHSILIVASMRQCGINGFEQDDKKVFKDLVESADLGNRDACYALWNCYIEGSGVERDMNLAKYWCQVAALRGCSASRVELANFDLKARDPESAVRHLMISCRQGNDDGLNFLGRLYRVGLKRKDPCVTKDQYAEALRSHKKCADSMKSDSRAAAVAFARSLKSMFSSDFGFFFDDPNAVESRDDD